MGSTLCRSHSTRGHCPKAPNRNFSFISASPRGERTKRAWMSPYKSIALWYNSRKLWLLRSSDSGFSYDRIICIASLKYFTFSRSPCKLKLSRIYSSSTSTKNSWPSKSQNQDTQPLPVSESSSSYKFSTSVRVTDYYIVPPLLDGGEAKGTYTAWDKTLFIINKFN
jgi:hypothetical protein